MSIGNLPSPYNYQFFQEVISESDDVIVAMDEEYDTLFTSKAFRHYAGLRKADIIGHTAAEVLGEQLFNGELKSYIDISLHGKRTTFEMPFTHPKLGNRLLHLKTYPVHNNGTRAVVMVARDITKLKRREQSLQRYHQMYRTLMDHANDILLLMSPDGIIISCSKFLDKQTGFSRKTLIGRSIQTLLSPASFELAVRHLQEYINHHTYNQSWTAEVIDINGEVVPFDIHSTPVYERGNLKQVVIVARNITEHSRIEEELKRSYNELKARSEVLTRESQERLQQMEAGFQKYSLKRLEIREKEYNNLGHELHDELGGYLTTLRLFLNKMAKEPGEGVWIEQIKQIFDEMTEYIQSLAHSLYPAVLQRDGLLTALEGYAKDYQRRTGIEVNLIHRGIQGRPLPHVETSVYRIIQEALTNVAKYAKVTSVKVILSQQNDIISAIVHDKGRGFDPSKVRATAGGIAGMEDRALLAGGNLAVNSSPGQGTSVGLTIPIHEYRVEEVK